MSQKHLFLGQRTAVCHELRKPRARRMVPGYSIRGDAGMSGHSYRERAGRRAEANNTVLSDRNLLLLRVIRQPFIPCRTVEEPLRRSQRCGCLLYF
jgi:hypothetical protein